MAFRQTRVQVYVDETIGAKKIPCSELIKSDRKPLNNNHKVVANDARHDSVGACCFLDFPYERYRCHIPYLHQILAVYDQRFCGWVVLQWVGSACEVYVLQEGCWVRIKVVCWVYQGSVVASLWVRKSHEHNFIIDIKINNGLLNSRTTKVDPMIISSNQIESK